MNTKPIEQQMRGIRPASDAELIANYRAGAAKRRAESKLLHIAEPLPTGVQIKDGVVTVTLAPDAKPVSELGGETRVFGRSQLSNPEHKR